MSAKAVAREIAERWLSTEWDGYQERLAVEIERAILAAVEAEREACAKLAEAMHESAHAGHETEAALAQPAYRQWLKGRCEAASTLAEDIRARGGRDGKGEPLEAKGRRDAAR